MEFDNNCDSEGNSGISPDTCNEMRRGFRAGVQHKKILESCDSIQDLERTVSHLRGDCECEEHLETDTLETPIEEDFVLDRAFLRAVYFIVDVDFRKVARFVDVEETELEQLFYEEYELGVRVLAEDCGKLRQQRQAGVEYEKILEEYTRKEQYREILRHITGGCTCDATVSAVTEKPYASEELMRFFFFAENLDFTEIGFICDRHRETIKTWICEEHELSVVEDTERTSSKRIREMQRFAAENNIELDKPLENNF